MYEGIDTPEEHAKLLAMTERPHRIIELCRYRAADAARKVAEVGADTDEGRALLARIVELGGKIREAATMKTEKRSCTFAAAHVPFLAQFDGERRMDFWSNLENYGLQVEPHPDGGVWLTTTDGRTMAQVWDKTGHASAPCIITMPTPFVDACTAPARPTYFSPEHDSWRPKLPPWMEPGRVAAFFEVDTDCHESSWHAFSCVTVEPKEQPPGAEKACGDGVVLYAFTPHRHSMHGAVGYVRNLVPWAQILDADYSAASPTSPLKLNPKFVARFAKLGLVELRSTGDDKPILVRVGNRPDVRGAIMPVKTIDTESAYAAERAASEGADA